MPNVLNGVDATIVSKVAEAFAALDTLISDAKSKREFLVKAFNSQQGWQAKEALKQEAFVKPRLAKGSPQKSVNVAWSNFMKACDDDGFMLARWTIDTPEAVRKREAREKATKEKPKAVAEAEAKLKALKEEAAAKAKAEAEERKNVKEKLAACLKAMGTRELEKVLHFALKVSAK